MADHRPSRFLSPDDIVTRRRLVAVLGTGLLAGAIAPSAFGHDDHHDNDDDDDEGRDRGRGRGRDDDDVRPVGTVPAGSAEVRITDDDADGFEPGTITIDAGQSVTWVNLDDDPHTATGAAFDTGILQPGELSTVTFDEPGTFPYSCQIHPEMTGIVEVRTESGARAAPPEATPDASPAASPVAGSTAEVVVDIANFAFDPAELRVRAGTTVTWTNRDDVPHTATASDGAFDSGMLNNGEASSHTFDEAGTFDYFCAFHPDMKGTVIVTD